MKLRSWRKGDENNLVKLANNRKVSINLRDRFPFPYTMKDALEWLEIANEPSPIENFAIEFENQAVGGIGVVPRNDIFRHTAEIGYWLGEPFWGKGIMTRALIEMTQYAFDSFDFHRLYAGVFHTNPASARILEKAGYHLESRMVKSVIKEGKLLDQLMYVKLR